MPFDIALPPNNILGIDIEKNPPAIYSPVIDDGFYVMLKPLQQGLHTIHFHAESGTFVQEVTYNLDIVPVLLK